MAGSDDSSRGMAGADGDEYCEVLAEADGYGGGGSKVNGAASELAVDGQRLDKNANRDWRFLIICDVVLPEI